MTRIERLTITVNTQPRPTPQVVTLRRLRTAAAEAGYANADTIDLAGITLPLIRVNQEGINYELRRTRAGNEFRFDQGELVIEGWQTVRIGSHMSSCEQGIWTRHEMDHVHDNEGIFSGLAASYQADTHMQSVFGDRPWQSQESFNRLQLATQATCFRIFTNLVHAAVRRRDTPSEYRQVRSRIQERCGGERTRPPERRGEE